jgi:hypothetical protein
MLAHALNEPGLPDIDGAVTHLVLGGVVKDAVLARALLRRVDEVVATVGGVSPQAALTARQKLLLLHSG